MIHFEQPHQVAIGCRVQFFKCCQRLSWNGFSNDVITCTGRPPHPFSVEALGLKLVMFTKITGMLAREHSAVPYIHMHAWIAVLAVSKINCACIDGHIDGEIARLLTRRLRNVDRVIN